MTTPQQKAIHLLGEGDSGDEQTHQDLRDHLHYTRLDAFLAGITFTIAMGCFVAVIIHGGVAGIYLGWLMGACTVFFWFASTESINEITAWFYLSRGTGGESDAISSPPGYQAIPHEGKVR